jgi:tRNA A37 threonylcarbamoyladenosine modification protein TsaB
MILALKTADATSELWLVDFDENKQMAVKKSKKWQAGRELGRTLLFEIEKFLPAAKWQAVDGLVIFRGGGSFTGLRIGVSTMNAIAYSNSLPIVGTGGENWLESGFDRLQKHQNDKIVVPDYGAEAKVTKSKK